MNKILMGLILGIILIGTVEATSSENWSLSLNSGLYNYYKCNGLTVDGIDDMGRMNLNTYNSADTKPTVKGIINKGYWTNNAEGINASSGRYENITGNWTINMWMNITDVNTWTMFIGEGAGLSNYIGRHDVDGRITMKFDDNGLGGDFTGNCSKISRGKWEMYTISYNGSMVKAYINGTYCAHYNIKDYKNVSFIFSEIGTGYAFGYGIDGSFDEVGIWNRTLNETEITSLYQNGNGISYNTTTDTKIQFTMKNSITGASIEPICSVNEGTISSNYTYIKENYISDTLSCTLNGYSNLLYNILSNEESIEINMMPMYLNLWFRNATGDLRITNGYWTDGTQTQNFTSNNLTINVLNLSEGVTKVYFGYNETIQNYTQFYDFENDWVTNVNENMTIITGSTNRVYMKVIDLSGNPINDALIKVAFSNIVTGGTYKEMGQRFTGGYGINGVTYFYIDPESDVSIRITKDGYTAKTILDNIKLNEYTSSNPLVVLLTRGENEVYHGVSVVTQQSYNTNDTTIKLFVYAPSRSTVSFTTSYDPSQNWTISLDEFKQGSYTLQKGVQYCTDCSTDLNITMQIDGSYYNNLIIKNKANDEMKFTTPSGLNNDIKFKMVWIMLLFGVGIAGFLFKGSNEGEGIGNGGEVLFMIGCGIIPIIFVGDFIFLIVIVAFYTVGSIIKRWVAE